MTDESSASGHSVSDWIVSLKRNTATASTNIWHRYVDQLVREADRRLKSMPRRSLDADDIAQEAFAAFFRGVAENRFSKLDDRADLWSLLVMLAERRAMDHMRREFSHGRGENRVRGDSVMEPGGNHTGSVGFDNLEGPPVTPESAEALLTLIQRSFPELADEELQRIALDRASNYSVAEIAQRHRLSQRTTERKLELICQILQGSVENIS